MIEIDLLYILGLLGVGAGGIYAYRRFKKIIGVARVIIVSIDEIMKDDKVEKSELEKLVKDIRAKLETT